MHAAYKVVFIFFFIVAVGISIPRSASAQALHAIVEKDGAVVLRLPEGGITFSDRCEGTGQFRIVQPISEGPVVWQE